MQWYTMMNAHNIVPTGTGRHVIVMQDDVVLAEDFDELLRRALLEAEEKGDDYLMSLYVANSMQVQINADGEIVPLMNRKGKLAVDPNWNVFNDKEGQEPRSRGSDPLLLETYIWGHQAVVYSASIADEYNAYFAKCERSMMRTLEAAKSGDEFSDEMPCIQVDDLFNKKFRAGRKKSTPFYTTHDSLVQHIGLSSAIQNIDGLENMLFHHNVELGTVSEDYGDDTNTLPSQ